MEQILGLRINLKCLGVPILKLRCMFGDNDSIVNSKMTSQGKIHKRHLALSFHRVREAMSAKIISYHFINGKINPACVLSKHLAHHSV